MKTANLSPLALEVAVCLPRGRAGALMREIVADVFDSPLYADPQPELPDPDRRRQVRAALREIKCELGRKGLILEVESAQPPGEQRTYGLSLGAFEAVQALETTWNAREKGAG